MQGFKRFGGTVHSSGIELHRFADVRGLAAIFAFTFVLWLMAGGVTTDREKLHIMELSISVLICEGAALFFIGFLGERYPRACFLLLTNVVCLGVVWALLAKGPFFYGRDLVLIFNGLMGLVVGFSIRRYGWSALGRTHPVRLNAPCVLMFFVALVAELAIITGVQTYRLRDVCQKIQQLGSDKIQGREWHYAFINIEKVADHTNASIAQRQLEFVLTGRFDGLQVSCAVQMNPAASR